MYRVHVARKRGGRRKGFRVRRFGKGEGWTKKQAFSFARGKRVEIAGEKNMRAALVKLFKHPENHHIYIVTE